MENVFEKFFENSSCEQKTETILPVSPINLDTVDSISDEVIVTFQCVESPNNTTHQTRKQSKPKKLNSIN